MKKIKILHIIKSLGRGGAEMLLPETLQIHNRKKFEFHYIYFLPWKNQMVSAIEKNGGKVTCLPAQNNLQLLKQYPKIINYCKANNIDLIHAHLPWAGFVSRIVHKKTKIPVIYTEHNLQERYHFITKTLNKFTYNWQNLALGVSEDVSRSIKKHINPEVEVQTLLNGVNTDKFQRNNDMKIRKREELGIPRDAIVIGNVAVFRFQKRLPEWLKIMKQIIDKNPNVYGLLVGAGILENEVKKIYNELNLQNRLIMPGLQTQMQDFYNVMDIFMMSSSFEGLPIALLEAMSMECAVVSTDAGGIKQVIRDEKDGLLCPVDRWKKLSELAEQLINDPKKLNLLKKNARKRIIDNFSMDKMVSELEEIYQKILQK